MAKFTELTFRNCLENRNGPRSESPQGPKGSKGGRSGISCRQRSPVQRSSAIFQTDSPRTRVNRVQGRRIWKEWCYHAFLMMPSGCMQRDSTPWAERTGAMHFIGNSPLVARLAAEGDRS